MRFAKRFWSGNNRLLVEINYCCKRRDEIYQESQIGRSSFSNFVQKAFQAVKIIGYGVQKEMKLSGLRGTVMRKLFEAGFDDSTVMLRSAHQSKVSLAAYQNLQESLRKRQ